MLKNEMTIELKAKLMIAKHHLDLAAVYQTYQQKKLQISAKPAQLIIASLFTLLGIAMLAWAEASITSFSSEGIAFGVSLISSLLPGFYAIITSNRVIEKKKLLKERDERLNAIKEQWYAHEVKLSQSDRLEEQKLCQYLKNFEMYSTAILSESSEQQAQLNGKEEEIIFPKNKDKLLKIQACLMVGQHSNTIAETIQKFHNEQNIYLSYKKKIALSGVSSLLGMSLTTIFSRRTTAIAISLPLIYFTGFIGAHVFISYDSNQQKNVRDEAMQEVKQKWLDLKEKLAQGNAEEKKLLLYITQFEVLETQVSQRIKRIIDTEFSLVAEANSVSGKASNLSPRSEPSQELTSTAEDKEEIVSNESVFKI